MASWPDGAKGALSLSFDNLGVDEASSAARALPGLLKRLGEHDLTATFFAEGVNAELDPGALREIGAAGHEVAYHAWLHEQWDKLSVTEQAENLARGIGAFEGIGLTIAGMRPPGGQLGRGGLEVLREAGLRYCSPAGRGAGAEGGVALLPFEWRHVDAASVLPPLAPIREQMTDSPDPLDPDTLLTFLEGEIERLKRERGFMAIVLHLALLDWFGADNLAALFGKLASTELWVARCDDIAEHVLAGSADIEDGATLDPTSWA